MKKFLLFTLFSMYFLLCIYAQEVAPQTVFIGKIYATEKVIEGQKIDFPQVIREVGVDYETQWLFLKLQKFNKWGGTLAVYQPFEKQMKWEYSINAHLDQVLPYPPYIFCSGTKDTKCYDWHTGEVRWAQKGSVAGVHNSVVVLTKSSISSSLHKVCGVDIQTGKILWERKFNMLTGINLYGINDTTVILQVNGLHAMHIRTGKGWDYKAMTGGVDLETETPLFRHALLAESGVGLALGDNDAGSFIRNLSSGILVDSSDLYWAGRNVIVRLKKDGKVVWEKPLPQDNVSRSAILLKDGIIYMFNYGIAEKGGSFTQIGKPFVAAYRKEDGEQLFCNIAFDERENMKDFCLLDTSVCVVYTDRIIKYTFRKGIVEEKVYRQDSGEKFEFFVERGIYRKGADSLLYDWIAADTTQKVVYTNRSRFLVLDRDLNLKSMEEQEEMYTEYLHWKNYRFLYRQGSMYIMDENHKLVAELNVSADSFIVENRLYDVSVNRLIIVDLEKLSL